MNIQIKAGKVKGHVVANASKSAMQRACAAALIRKGVSVISNTGNSNDDLAALSIIKGLGATVEHTGQRKIRVKGTGPQIVSQSGSVNCGESGLSIRMFTPIAALSKTPVTMLGEGSLTTRPMHFFEEVLPALGVQVQANGGVLPLTVSGPLQPENIVVDGTLSSQFLTGLLMAYAAQNPINASITVIDLKSKPYIDLTLEVLAAFGLPVPEHHQHERFHFRGEDLQDIPEVHYTVEGDWSGGAFLLVAAAIAGELTVEGLRNTSKQADKKIIDALLDAGAEVTVGEHEVQVKQDKLQAFQFDATHCPDLFPPLVALAANCNGISIIRGLRRLKHKESDRGTTLQEEFAKLGVTILLKDDEMHVYGEPGGLKVRNTRCNSHHDHRIAMAVAVAALRADFDIDIRHADAVNKSYPDFWEHLKTAGVHWEQVGNSATTAGNAT